MRPQTDDPLAGEVLDRALRALPRALPGPGFSATVMARSAGAARRRGLRRRRIGALTAGVLVLAAAFGAWSFEGARARAERRAALLDEHRRLLDELGEIRELSAHRSQIRLGGDAGTDLYFDLATVPALASMPLEPQKSSQTRSHG